MNKPQKILAAIGGISLVGALALGYFIWDASSKKAENAETLEDSLAAAGNLVKKLPVKPEKSALSVYKDNAAAYDAWRAEAEKLAARGDLVFENTTPAVLKTALVTDARRLSDLPGCFDGKFVKPDFHFGFRDYITGGALPPGDSDALKRLQREWNDVSSVLKTLAECGGSEIGVSDVRLGKAKAAAQEEEEEASSAKKRKAKGKAKKAKAAVTEEEPVKQAVTSFTVEFHARPSALVKALNAFATGTRFIVVEDCSFVRTGDALAETLGGDAKRSEQQSRATRRRRGGKQEPQPAEEEVRKGLVTDPATAPLLKVTMAFSVYDFGTLEQAQAEAESEEKQGEDEQ